MLAALRRLYRDLKTTRREFGRIRERSRWEPSLAVKYGVKAGYRHRTHNDYFDDTEFAGAHGMGAQLEVYERALVIAKELDAQTMFDVGCGSAAKLVHYFDDFKTVGFDVPETVAKLNRRYPQKQWRAVPLDSTPSETPDIVICSDVIEHIPDPDLMMGFLKRMQAKRYIVSTPERRMMYGIETSGPPSNPAHCREWDFNEFAAFISSHLKIVDHYISNYNDKTQVVIGEPL